MTTRWMAFALGAAVLFGPPAYAQQKTVHWLKWVDFVPATDQMFRREMMPEAEKALGVKMNLETVNANDLQPRLTSAIQSGAGADIIMSLNSFTHLYANSVVDMGALAEEVGKREGGIYKYAQAICSNGKGVYMGMPWAVIGGMIAYRKSWFDEIGVAKFPDTWESYREAGKKLKAKGRPIGQTQAILNSRMPRSLHLTSSMPSSSSAWRTSR